MSFGNTFDISYELTPIGLLISLNEYSTENFVFSLHNIIPIVGLSLSVFIKSSTADFLPYFTSFFKHLTYNFSYFNSFPKFADASANFKNSNLLVLYHLFFEKTLKF